MVYGFKIIRLISLNQIKSELKSIVDNIKKEKLINEVWTSTWNKSTQSLVWKILLKMIYIEQTK